MSHEQEHQADRHANRRAYIQGTDYALPYVSNWSSSLREDELELLKHVNCSLLSTPHVPPTLLALKQHAQALCRLIERFEPLDEIVQVNQGPQPEGYYAAQGANAFDWLNDLTVPYTNEHPDHHRPLHDLVNWVKTSSDIKEPTYHCPLEVHEPRKADGVRRPFLSHEGLLMHANECLERLDHEYSSTGGLLSLLPTDQEHDADNLRGARNTLVGQWLMYTQALAGRTHELELAYGNATDALAGEAVIPLQHLSAFGPDARSGREPAFPQDRWVLVNAGDDVFDHVHELLDRVEALAEQREQIWRGDRGALGERLWLEERGGRAYARGIVPVDVTTRYYRLKGRGRHTLFVCPAWSHHPATAATRALEARPTVVSVAAPRYPERVSDLERRWVADSEAAAIAARETEELRARVHRGDSELALLNQHLAAEKRTRGFFERAHDKTKDELATQVDKLAADLEEVKAHRDRLAADKARLEKDRAARVEHVNKLREQLVTAEAAARDAEANRNRVMELQDRLVRNLTPSSD